MIIDNPMSEHSSGRIDETISAICSRIGYGVRDISFQAFVGEDSETLTPENTGLSLASCTPHSMVFMGGRQGVSVEWKFAMAAEGVSVSLKLLSDKALRCTKLNPVMLTFESAADSVDDWRLLATTRESGLMTVALLDTPEAADQDFVTRSTHTGAFPDSRGIGVFLGTILPQKYLHRYCVSRRGNRELSFVAECDLPAVMASQKVINSETTWICARQTASGALDVYASLHPRMPDDARPLTGWNSWDYYFTSVSADDMVENMEEIRRDRELYGNLESIIVDMGWQTREGDWQPNYRFPEGLESMASAIADRGFVPGIWTAPFLAEKLSYTALRIPEVLLRDEYGDPIVNWEQYYLLDPTHPRSKEIFTELYTRLYRIGYRIFKLDFLNEILGAHHFHDETKGHYEAIGDMLRLVRECVTDESHMIGCGFPRECGPGLVDSARISTDIHNQWSHIEWAFDGFLNSYWIHKRIALVDPDFLIVRGRDTSLEEETNVLNPNQHNPDPPRWRRGPVFNCEEARTWASIVAMSGGNMFLSDRLSMLNDKARELIRKVITPVGVAARPLDLCDGERPSIWLQEINGEYRLTMINWTDTHVRSSFDFSAHGLSIPALVENFWTGDVHVVEGGRVGVEIASHGVCVLLWKHEQQTNEQADPRSPAQP